MDFYGDNLLNPDKKRNQITRQDVLNIINKTEEDLKEGLTIQDIVPFFERYRVPLRVLNTLYTCIYRYDPPVQDRHYPVMYYVKETMYIHVILG